MTQGAVLQEAVRSSPTHVAFAGVESAQDAVADAVEGWEVLFDASCLAHGGVGDLFSALREAPRPTAAVVCSSADGSAEAAALKHALGVVGEATGGRWAAVYVGGEGMSPKAPTRGGRSLRNVPATEQCDRKCRTQVAAIEAVIVALVLISFIVPSYFLMRKLESPSKFEKSGEHRD